MKKNKYHYLFCFSLSILLCFSASAQKKLAVIKVRNNHAFYFSEGKKILCKTYDAADSVKVKHTGALIIISDSVIRIGSDTLKLNDIIAVKKYYSVASKLGFSCIFSYLGLGQLAVAPLGIAGYFWAVSQGVDESTAGIAAIVTVYVGGYIFSYFMISNAAIFHSYNNIGTKYKLNIIR